MSVSTLSVGVCRGIFFLVFFSLFFCFVAIVGSIWSTVFVIWFVNEREMEKNVKLMNQMYGVANFCLLCKKHRFCWNEHDHRGISWKFGFSLTERNSIIFISETKLKKIGF